MTFKPPRFISSQVMVSIALYSEAEEQNAGESSMGASSQKSSHETEGDENDASEQSDYRLYTKVKQVKTDKMKFFIFVINIMFKSDEILEKAKQAEFCLLSKYICFRF